MKHMSPRAGKAAQRLRLCKRFAWRCTCGTVTFATSARDDEQPNLLIIASHYKLGTLTLCSVVRDTCK